MLSYSWQLVLDPVDEPARPSLGPSRACHDRRRPRSPV